MSTEQNFTNRLAGETSPYLLQHAHNPVDWYPWGPEALELARREDKPIFLSIGYSACHWCHVMEHQSFEDPETAALMNEHFVNIKVDREERPDLDQIYMSAVQMMARHGGWPMSVFLTPDLEPFYGGTYFPPQPQMGMPSFRQVLLAVTEVWWHRRGEVTRSAGQMAGVLRQMNQLEATGPELSLNLVDRAVGILERVFDPVYGGFGGAPKFPHPMDLKVCLRSWKRTGNQRALEMVTVTLDRMARGGIYDQLGGGFHRYATDQRWLVPHFEKMLYDNALLTQDYLEAYQATHERAFAQIARETLDYVLREMTSPEGGYYSTQDADTEGEEGKFFVWSLEELRKVLGPKAAEQFAYVYDVSKEGNWEGKNILNRPKTTEQCAKLLCLEARELERSLAESRGKLSEVRLSRVQPGRDEKVLVSWNGLMIDAMAKGYQVLGDQRYLEGARRAARFILSRMWQLDGEHAEDVPRADRGARQPKLRHCFKDGRARFGAYLDDYANSVDALVTLYESDFQPEWLSHALELSSVMIDQFWDEEGGSFFFTARDHEPLVVRTRDVHDSSTPSASAMAITALIRLGKLTGRSDLLAKTERALQAFTNLMDRASTAAGQLLVALEQLRGDPIEIAIAAGDQPEEPADILRLIRQHFIPNKVVALRPATTGVASVAGEAESKAVQQGQRSGQPEGPGAELPLLADRPAVNGHTTVYICQNFSCQAPAIGREEVERALSRFTPSSVQQ